MAKHYKGISNIAAEKHNKKARIYRRILNIIGAILVLFGGVVIFGTIGSMDNNLPINPVIFIIGIIAVIIGAFIFYQVQDAIDNPIIIEHNKRGD